MKLNKFFWVLIFILAACSEGENKIPEANQNTYVSSAKKWDTTNLSVCFTNLSAISSDDVFQIQNSVELAFHDFTVLRFNGWGSCDTTASPNIIIRITNDMPAFTPNAWPRTTAFGISLNGKNPGMYLSTSFNNICADDPANKGNCLLSPGTSLPKIEFTSCRASEAARIACIRNITVHEFGHAIALSHEQNRSDTPTTCKVPAQGENGDTTFGSAWDLVSIMNYCNPTWNNNAILSKGDEFGIGSLYGFPVESSENLDSLAITSYIF